MISTKIKKLLPIAWFLPGFLLWAAYPPMGEVADVLFALAPLMWLTRRAETAKGAAKRWFQSGIFYWIATLSWMPAIVKNGGPWPLVVLGWFALAAYCALYFWAYGYLSATYWSWVRNTNTRTPHYIFRLLGILFVEPILWCGLELVRSRFLGGFAWNQLGVVSVNAGFGAPASLGGVYLCSALIILINGTIAGIAERMWKPEKSGFANLKRLGPLETVLAFTLVFAVYQTATHLQPAPGDTRTNYLKVALIQRNFPCVFKAQEENPDQIYDKLLDNVVMLKPDLVVLPESAMCEFGSIDSRAARRWGDWVLEKTGAFGVLAGGSRDADGKTYNSAALYLANGAEVWYDKVHLVPFGEFIPGDKIFPALQKLAPVGSCTPGELKLLSLIPNPQTSQTSKPPKLSLGIAICFEDTDSAQMRTLAKRGAQALVFITNDSWFSHSIEAEQHAWQAVARAIETGLPVVRVGNSGVTGTISPTGKATWLLGPNGRPLVDRPGTMFDRLMLPDSQSPDAKTLYVLFGDWPLGVLFALLIGCLILVKYKS